MTLLYSFQAQRAMTDNIIPYFEMCRREGTSLQQGMNFGLGGGITQSF